MVGCWRGAASTFSGTTARESDMLLALDSWFNRLVRSRRSISMNQMQGGVARWCEDVGV